MNALLLSLALSVSITPPAWLDLALRDRTTVPAPGEVKWTEREPGLETAELDATLSGLLVDRIHLVRLDVRRFEFEVFHDANDPVTVDAWRERLGASVVINGSFYEMDLQPQTPVRAGGRPLGPAAYRSRHGAFVAGRGAAILDLAGQDALASIAPFRNAMVSYPLLLAPDGKVRAAGKDTWLANRTFVAVDRQGRVVVGTTENGFFSLRRLGQFLAASPLGLGAALNLDGGPPACQAVSSGGFEKVVYGRWELNDSSGREVVYWGAEEVRWELPLVLAAFPRREGKGR